MVAGGLDVSSEGTYSTGFAGVYQSGQTLFHVSLISWLMDVQLDTCLWSTERGWGATKLYY
jgi:hypothetical protein